MKSTYVVTYLSSKGDDCVEEIYAYSLQQAKYIASVEYGILLDTIVDIEQVSMSVFS